tara:strand:+ start:2996 stop:4198 length:1203 start_codon:yes stop_codon:yes gene_type:complete
MMNKKYYLIPVLMTTALSVAAAEDTVDQRVSQLEQEIQLLKSSSASDIADRIKVNGFFSVGATRSNNDAGYAGSNDSYELNSLSLLGLQAEFTLSEQTSVVSQLVAKGEDDYDPSFEWAYIKHTFDNDVTVRGGKLRVPIFMYSDFLDVGYAQPFIRPPEEVYGAVPFSTYVGGDIAYDLELDDSTIQLQAFAGKAKEGNIEFNYMYGASAGWQYDNLLLRAVYGTSQISVPSTSSFYSIIPEDTKAEFFGLGLKYDDGANLITGEYTTVEVDGQMSDTKSAYLTYGRRFGDWMPYVTIARLETTDNSERVGQYFSLSGLTAPMAPFFNAERDAYSLGVRYDVMSNVSIKADATLINNFGDTVGLLFDPANPAPINIDLTTLSANQDDSLVYSIRLDCVF